MRAIAPVAAAFALAACGFALAACPPFFVDPPPPPPAVDLDTGCSTTTQAVAIFVAGDVSFHADHGGAQCVPQSTQCGDSTSCGVLVGNVAVGSDERVDVAVGNFGQGPIDLSSVTIDSASDGWYVEGEPPTFVDAGQSATISLMLRPTTVGACDAKLVVASDAQNAPKDNVALELHANCTAGATEGCAVDNACCCANASTLEAPTCSDDRVTCATGFVAFDDACGDAPCVP